MPKKESEIMDKDEDFKDLNFDGHRFFLNPYDFAACTRCPLCDRLTKVRKIPLAIHIEPQTFFVLNKSCRFCEDCDLLIARRQDVEALMAAVFAERDPSIVGNRYEVLGTLSKKDWRDRDKHSLSPKAALERVEFFSEVLNITISPPGWYPADQVPS
jgi:hypothetical protein